MQIEFEKKYSKLSSNQFQFSLYLATGFKFIFNEFGWEMRTRSPELYFGLCSDIIPYTFVLRIHIIPWTLNRIRSSANLNGLCSMHCFRAYNFFIFIFKYWIVCLPGIAGAAIPTQSHSCAIDQWKGSQRVFSTLLDLFHGRTEKRSE